MARFECNCCHGQFISPLPSGHDYYHVCPPFSPHELIAGVADGSIVPDAKLQELVVTASTPDTASAAELAAREAALSHLANVVMLRPGHVNQNVILPGAPIAPGEHVAIRSAGDGVSRLEA